MYRAVSIGLQNPKSATNVASILRAAGCFGVSSVFYTGQRFRHAKEFNADTKAYHRVIPTVGVDHLRTCFTKRGKRFRCSVSSVYRLLRVGRRPHSRFGFFTVSWAGCFEVD